MSKPIFLYCSMPRSRSCTQIITWSMRVNMVAAPVVWESDQNHVVAFLPVLAFHLQRDRLADELLEHREMLGLFVQEEIDHPLRRDDAKFLRVELARFAHDLAQDLIADGLRRLQLAAPLTFGARLAQDVRQ